MGVVIERMSFSQQVTELQETTELVAIHGQGAANTAFMKPGSSLVLIVPPRWDAEKFLFANFAVANGVHVFLFEYDNTTDLKMKPQEEKDIWVDPARFEKMLERAVAVADSGEARIHFWADEIKQIELEQEERMKQLELEKEKQNKNESIDQQIDEQSQQQSAQQSQEQAQHEEKLRKIIEELKEAKDFVALLENDLARLQQAGSSMAQHKKEE